MPKSIDYVPPSAEFGGEPIPGLSPEAPENERRTNPETTGLRERMRFARFTNPLAIAAVGLLSSISSIGCTAGGAAQAEAMIRRNSTQGVEYRTDVGVEIGTRGARPYARYYQTTDERRVGDQSPSDKDNKEYHKNRR